jgi:aminoglycoside/choline kinase family phosphotransferase
LFPSEFSGLETLARRTRHAPVRVEILPGDVGRRRYLRLTLPDNRTVLGVVYPAEEDEARKRWLGARAALRDRVRVPQLIADDGAGNQIVEDFGRDDLAALLGAQPKAREEWLARAAEAAAAIAGIPDPRINAPFDAAFFRRELDLAREAVFDLYQGRPLEPAEREAHDAFADALCAEIAAHPGVLCHRDFHVNNLFPLGEAVGAIDFQDLRSGPDAYDLASLLWERTTLPWMSPALAAEVTSEFARRRRVSSEELDARLKRVLLQRAWKVCGTFARAVAQGRGETYRSYLPGELALVGRLLRKEGAEDRFRGVLEGRFWGLEGPFPSVC